MKDEQYRCRPAFDKLQEDGTVAREFLPYFSNTGHPSVDPTERYVLVDNYDKRPGHITLDVLDLAKGETHQLAQCKRTAFGPDGEPLRERHQGRARTREEFWRENYIDNAKYRTQAHPVWDHTGRYVAFNSDADGTAQVYIADLTEYGLYST